MRINDIIFEDGDKLTKEELLKEPFFQYNDPESVLLHSSNLTNIDTYKLLEFQPRKRPTDTGLYFHNTVNKMMYEKFKVPLRTHTLFSYTDKITLKSGRFSSKLIIVPKGDYNLYYHPAVQDMTHQFDAYSDDLFGDIKSNVDLIFDEFELSIKDFIEEEYPNHKNIHNLIAHDIMYYLNEEIITELENTILNIDGIKDTLHDLKAQLKEYLKTKYFPNNKIEIDEEDIDSVILPTELMNSIRGEIYDQIFKNINKKLEEIYEYVEMIEVSKEIPSNSVAEIMIHCKEFYAFDFKYYVHDLFDLIRKDKQ